MDIAGLIVSHVVSTYLHHVTDLYDNGSFRHRDTLLSIQWSAQFQQTSLVLSCMHAVPAVATIPGGNTHGWPWLPFLLAVGMALNVEKEHQPRRLRGCIFHPLASARLW